MSIHYFEACGERTWPEDEWSTDPDEATCDACVLLLKMTEGDG